MLGRGKTGSGKTLAFSIPMVARLGGALAGGKRRPGRPLGLVLAPTRELATQIDAVLAAARRRLRPEDHHDLRRHLAEPPGRRPSRAGVDIVVACPGRLEDLMKQGFVTLDAVEITVLDEADHMADLGFLPVVTRIMDKTPHDGQRLLFSATLDNGVDKLVKRFLHNEVLHSVDEATSHVAAMTHHVFEVDDVDAKNDLVKTLASGTGRRILFMRTKHHAKKLAQEAHRAGHPRRRPARQPVAAAARPQPRRVLRRRRPRSSSPPTSRPAACTSTTSSSSSTSTRPWSTRRTCTARAAPPAPAARATSSPSCLPAQKQDLEDAAAQGRHHRDAAARHRRARRAVTALVGDVAAYVKPAPRAAAAAGRRRSLAGRQRPAQARRPRRPAAPAPVRAAVAAVATAAARRTSRPPRLAGTGRVVPPRPRRTPRSRARGHSRGAQSTGAQRGASARSGAAKQPLRVGSLVVAVAQQPSRAGLTPRTPEGPADRWSTGPSSCHRLRRRHRRRASAQAACRSISPRAPAGLASGHEHRSCCRSRRPSHP